MKILYKSRQEYPVSLCRPEDFKKDCPIAIVPAKRLWRQEPLRNKVKAILKLKYVPDTDIVQKVANQIFLEDLFGTKENLSDALFDLMIWHFDQPWKLSHLADRDNERSDALEASIMIERRRHWDATSPNLYLNLYRRQPLITQLVYPIVVKAPVRSILYFIELHSRFTFNSIRSAHHPFADDLIAYLYEIILINIKVAGKLHSIIQTVRKIQTGKKDNLLLREEVDALSDVEICINSIKAIIEKLIAFLGYTHNIKGIEDKKDHKSRLRTLDQHIPEQVKSQPAYLFFSGCISSNQLQTLNSYRTGILHKKGFSKNQPQAYYNNDKSAHNLLANFNFIHDYHCKSSAMIVAGLSLLTDEIIRLQPLEEFPNLPLNSLLKNIASISKEDTIGS